MTKGSPIIPIRIQPNLLDQINRAINNANANRRLEPYSRSSWILAAIQDKLAHLARARKRPSNSSSNHTHSLL